VTVETHIGGGAMFTVRLSARTNHPLASGVVMSGTIFAFHAYRTEDMSLLRSFSTVQRALVLNMALLPEFLEAALLLSNRRRRLVWLQVGVGFICTATLPLRPSSRFLLLGVNREKKAGAAKTPCCSNSNRILR